MLELEAAALRVDVIVHFLAKEVATSGIDVIRGAQDGVFVPHVVERENPVRDTADADVSVKDGCCGRGLFNFVSR